MAEQGRMEQLSEQPCFAGLLATAFGLAANVLASIHRTVKKHSQPEVGSRRRDGTRSSDLTGDASCNGLKFGEQRISCTLRLRDDILLAKPWEGPLEEESVELIGADVECTGVVVTLSRNSVIQFTMAFDSERVAGLWATKLAVACGSSESISKLFSTQRRRIYALEQRTAEAQMNNEEVERCLNFLSREYVEMRYQVRRQVADPSDATKAGAPALMEEKEEEEPLLIEDIDPPKLPSEPEKEPLNSARAATAMAATAAAAVPAPPALPATSLPAAASLQEIAEEPKKGSCLLGSSPSHPKRERPKPKKDLPLSLKDHHVLSRAEGTAHKGEETPSLPSPQRNATAATAERQRHLGHGHGRSTRDLKKEPLWSPKAFSPYGSSGTSIDCPGLDRRGHKLAMTHQRAPPRSSKDNHSTRKSTQGVGSSKTTVADKTSVAEKR